MLEDGRPHLWPKPRVQFLKLLVSEVGELVEAHAVGAAAVTVVLVDQLDGLPENCLPKTRTLLALQQPPWQLVELVLP